MRGRSREEGEPKAAWFPPPSLAAQQGVCSHHAVLSLVAGRHGCDISPFLRYEEQKKMLIKWLSGNVSFFFLFFLRKFYAGLCGHSLLCVTSQRGNNRTSGFLFSSYSFFRPERPRGSQQKCRANTTMALSLFLSLLPLSLLLADSLTLCLGRVG